MINLPDDNPAMLLPEQFACPHCGFPLYVEFDEWDDEGQPTGFGLHISCTNEEDGAHWDWPYVTIQPLQQRAYRWAAMHVRIGEAARV